MTEKNVNTKVEETKVNEKVDNNVAYVTWKGMIMSYKRYLEEREAEKD